MLELAIPRQWYGGRPPSGYNRGMTNIIPMSVWSLLARLAAFAPSLASGFGQTGVPRDAEESPPFGPLDDETVDNEQFDTSPEMLSRMFDDHVIRHSQKSMEALVGRMEQVLQARVEDLGHEFRLSETQKQKLRLAGHGDIKRLVIRIREERKPFESIETRNADLVVRKTLLAAAAAAARIDSRRAVWAAVRSSPRR